MLRVGLLINPYAGIGGPLALKGSDDVDVAQALTEGGQCLAHKRAQVALQGLLQYQDRIQWLTAPTVMGADVLDHLGFPYQSIGQLTSALSTAEDTQRLAVELVAEGVDTLLFVGGDGTARNIVDGLNVSTAYQQQLVVGIPAGVKMQSGVYAVSPQAAVRLLIPMVLQKPVSTAWQEVRDIDEEALRNGRINSRYYGDLFVPNDQRYIQQAKNTARQNEEELQLEIAASIIDMMEEDVIYIVGCGTTPRAIMIELGLPNTLLGVDVILGRELIAADVTQAELTALLDRYPHHRVILLVTAIGGQGHIIGRGNQQISAPVLSRIGKSNVVVLITASKLAELGQRPLFIDSGSTDLDKSWAGWITLHTAYQETAVYPLSCGDDV